MADFWRDPWCGLRSLKDKFPELLEICNDDQVCSVASKEQRNWILTFRRWLDEGLQNKLRELLDLVRTVPIAVGRDGPRWTWEKMFFVKSTYSHLCGGAPGHKNRRIWKAKIPLKIKIWMWLICKIAFLTKDNLAKIKWQGDKHCSFCNQEESIEHLMFDCSSAKYVRASPLMFLGSLVDLPISIRFGNGQNVTYKMGKNSIWWD